MAATHTNIEVTNDVSRIWPKTISTGIKVDVNNPTFPWVDLIGFIQPNTAGPGTSPTWGLFQEVGSTGAGVNGLYYDQNDVMDCVFHIPHDWVPDYNAEIHIHWGNDVQLEIGDTFSVTPTVTYGTRDGVFGTPITLESISYTATSALPIHSHPVTEVPLCRATDDAVYIAGNALDRSLIEVDGLVLVTFVVTSESLSNGGHLFFFTADIHHQSTGVGTKNNASPFYD